ncbi:hypothetical protein EGN72_10035 [Pseudorhodobacter sp. E13]|uniref:hypothetical protein n=1 Tax=Pseudorhodobacter sp. E13 TaxID=2487931 RepID=UPI000FB3A63B|nr:hypothetical protein [Pseudorhodobacter sp. E13]RUS60138.1 hypothetical protein EGN72_10035 [Pseudorhodobacter sp. E13]
MVEVDPEMWRESGKIAACLRRQSFLAKTALLPAPVFAQGSTKPAARPNRLPFGNGLCIWANRALDLILHKLKEPP